MKKHIQMAFIAFIGILCILPAISLWPQTRERETKIGPYTFVYQFFRGDYGKNSPVYARLTAALQKAGMKPTRSLGFFLDDPKTTSAEERRCICGVVIDEKDWPRIEALDDSAAAAEHVELFAAHKAVLEREMELMRIRLCYLDEKIAYWQAVEAGDAERVERMVKENRRIGALMK
jgi:hypothetical protein